MVNALNTDEVAFFDLMHLMPLIIFHQKMPGMPTASKNFLSSISSTDASRYCFFFLAPID